MGFLLRLPLGQRFYSHIRKVDRLFSVTGNHVNDIDDRFDSMKPE